MDISSRLVVNQAALKLKREPMRALIDAFDAAVGWPPMSRDAMRQLRHRRRRLRGRVPARAALVGRDRRGDRAARGRRSWPTCGRAATRRCWSTPRASTALQAASVAALETGAATNCSRAFDAITPAQRDALQAAAARVRSYHERQLDACGAQLELPRRRRHAAGPEGHAAGPRGHLRARRQGGLPVERADERDSGAGGRRRRDRHGGAHAAGASATRWCWPPPTWPACTAPSRSAARRRWRRWPTARPPCRASTRSPARAMPTWPAPSGACSARSAST